jgi:hypothetical protein
MTAENPTAVIRAITDDMTAQYTEELEAWVRERIPESLTDPQFAARSSALMIAIGRQLAAIAAAFGETHLVPSDEVAKLVMGQFRKNHAIAIAAIAAGQTVQ